MMGNPPFGKMLRDAHEEVRETQIVGEAGLGLPSPTEKALIRPPGLPGPGRGICPWIRRRIRKGAFMRVADKEIVTLVGLKVDPFAELIRISRAGVDAAERYKVGCKQHRTHDAALVETFESREEEDAVPVDGPSN